MNSISNEPGNEPWRTYSCMDDQNGRIELKDELDRIGSVTEEIPLFIGGTEVRTDDVFEVRAPHDREIILAKAHLAGTEEIEEAIESSISAGRKWRELDQYQRSVIFEKAASLLADKSRIRNTAAIMMNHSKNPYEAEIDLVELIDFWVFNSRFIREIVSEELHQIKGERNRFDWRPLEGFVLAVPPFNFYSISGNLPSSPALVGNTVLWKPSRSVIFSSHEIMKVLIEAGLPPGVINFLPFRSEVSKKVLSDPDLSGLHFTGSYATLTKLWRSIGENIRSYKNFPRIVGETGGKDFIIAHPSADITNLAVNLTRGAFGYQGQKCSAVSRAYIPESIWEEVKSHLLEQLEDLSFGDITDLEMFGGAVIDEHAYDKIISYIDHAKENDGIYEILIGGDHHYNKGYFVEPTIVVTSDPEGKLMKEEIFGPVLTVYVYPDGEYLDVLDLCDSTSPYGLTGAVFSRDRYAIKEAQERLRFAAGNFYINDKPTGAVVGRQPFGGSRHSGTNDKAGSKLNLLRWMQPRVIKETLVPYTDWKRPYQC